MRRSLARACRAGVAATPARGLRFASSLTAPLRDLCFEHLGETERECMPYDLCIVGGGPAGLAAAIRTKQVRV